MRSVFLASFMLVMGETPMVLTGSYGRDNEEVSTMQTKPDRPGRAIAVMRQYRHSGTALGLMQGLAASVSSRDTGV